MKLAQGQIWKTSPEVHSYEGMSVYLRIVDLERLSVTTKKCLKPTLKTAITRTLEESLLSINQGRRTGQPMMKVESGGIFSRALTGRS